MTKDILEIIDSLDIAIIHKIEDLEKRAYKALKEIGNIIKTDISNQLPKN